jgi:hypothetical protein
MNPARGRKTDYQPARVTIAVLTHLPDQSGYFQERFDVTRLCIESILANTTPPFDLMVFDNASCAPLVDYLRGLRDEGLINYLILSSQNIGKIGALQILLRAAPGEIIAYNDDDVYYLPGWLEEHLKLVDTYPRVGMVTGFYIRRPQELMSDEATLKFAEQPGMTVERGLLIPLAWEEEYIVNSGRTMERYRAETANVEDVALCYQGVEALVSAHHFQFLGPRQVLIDALPQDWSGKLMGQMVDIEKAIDRKGYLRLTTRQQTLRLLGNSLSEEMLVEARKIGLQIQEIKALKPPPARLGRLAQVSLIRRLAQGIYNRLYNFLNIGSG